jgi:hypothetical protein
MVRVKKIGSALEKFKEVTNDDELKKEIGNTIPGINDLNENSSYQDLGKAIQATYLLLTGKDLTDFDCKPNPNSNFNPAAYDISPNGNCGMFSTFCP